MLRIQHMQPPGQDAAQALLAQLEDIKLPESVGIWPLAPGWWLLIIVLSTTITLTIYYIVRRFKQNRYRHQALQLLSQVNVSDVSDGQFAKDVITLLKRTYITVSKTTLNEHQLSYQHWYENLSQLSQSDFFTPEDYYTLSQSIYKPDRSELSYEKRNEILDIAKKWVKTHRNFSAKTIAKNHTSIAETHRGEFMNIREDQKNVSA